MCAYCTFLEHAYALLYGLMHALIETHFYVNKYALNYGVS